VPVACARTFSTDNKQAADSTHSRQCVALPVVLPQIGYNIPKANNLQHIPHPQSELTVLLRTTHKNRLSSTAHRQHADQPLPSRISPLTCKQCTTSTAAHQLNQAKDSNVKLPLANLLRPKTKTTCHHTGFDACRNIPAGMLSRPSPRPFQRDSWTAEPKMAGDQHMTRS
jgi:hypothetical protein